MSARTGEELEFAKKGILHLLEHEICSNLCTHLIDKLAHTSNAFKNNSHSKRSILHFICLQGDTEVVRALLKLRPSLDFSIQDRDGISPAFYALVKGHTEVLKLLVSQGFKPIGPKETVLQLYHE